MRPRCTPEAPASHARPSAARQPPCADTPAGAQVGAYGYLGLIPRWLQEGVGGKGVLGKTIQELLLADGDGKGRAPGPAARRRSGRAGSRA